MGSIASIALTLHSMRSGLQLMTPKHILFMVVATFTLGCSHDDEPAVVKDTVEADNEVIERFLTETTRIATTQGMRGIASRHDPQYLSEYRKYMTPPIEKLMETVDGRVLYWRMPRDKMDRDKMSDQDFWKAAIASANDGAEGFKIPLIDLPDDYKVELIGTIVEKDVIYALVRQPQMMMGSFVTDLRVYGLRIREGKLGLVPNRDPVEYSKLISAALEKEK